MNEPHSSSPDPVVDSNTVMEWYINGTGLAPKAVADLETEIAQDADDLEARVKVLGYYARKRIGKNPAMEAAQPHILWIIKSRPDSAAAGNPLAWIDKWTYPAHYKQAEDAWNEQLAKQPGNTRVLDHAASFFLMYDREIAEELLRRAQALEPKNLHWPDRLGHLFSLNTMSNDARYRAENAEKALKYYEMALPAEEVKEDQPGELRFNALAAVAKAAYETGELTKAQAYAEELLALAPRFEADWNYGDAIYTGNSIMGLVALYNSNLDIAGDYLLAASKTPGSPTLNHSGPKLLLLAKQLLERGEKEVILTALENISTFWTSREGKIKEWKEAIREGKTPQFDRTY